MTNIFENAKFGDKFITKDGKIGIFLSKDCHYAELVYEDGARVKLHCSGKEQENKENDYDIVGRWKEPIDLEKMYNECERVYKDKGYDKTEQTLFGTANVDFTTFRWGYEEGYTKAKEE